MFNNKLIRYIEFTIPFQAYRAGDLTRDDFLQITLELKEIQQQQHEALLDVIERNEDLKKNHRTIYENLQETVRLFDEAIEITESALKGFEEDEEDQFEDAMETFRQGNLLLADAHLALDEMSERSELSIDI